MVGQGPFEVEFDALSAVGTKSKDGDHLRHTAFFPEVTSDWGVYRDSDIPTVSASQLETVLNGLSLFAVLLLGLKIASYLYGVAIAGFMSPVWLWMANVSWLAIIQSSWLFIVDHPLVSGLALFSDPRFLAAYNGGALIYKIWQQLNPKKETIKYSKRDEREVRYIWVGSGQAQFGCGTRGIAITNSSRFNYLLWWDKIDYIYYERDRRNLRFTEFSPWGEDEKPVKVKENDDFFFPDVDHYSNAPDQDAIRIRLVPGYPNQSFVEEIIIPKRFFGASREAVSRECFVQSCWEFKWRNAHVWPMRHMTTRT